MAKFGLKMSTQLGEKIAMEHGYTNFPINPDEIARSKDIAIIEKPIDAKGISGALIKVKDSFSIIYSTEHNNRGFERFSIAHELGHYFLPNHPQEIFKSGGEHYSRSNFIGNSQIELEADHFASGLLMPSRFVNKVLNSKPIGLNGIISLATQANTSITSAAIRAAECSEYPMAIVVSKDELISYCFMSEQFKNLGQLRFLKKSTPLPLGTTTQIFNLDNENVINAKTMCGQTNLFTWFDGNETIKLDEEIVGLGRYGFTLTVLSSEEINTDTDDDVEDDEESLKASWTPKFAYGR